MRGLPGRYPRALTGRYIAQGPLEIGSRLRGNAPKDLLERGSRLQRVARDGSTVVNTIVTHGGGGHGGGGDSALAVVQL
jgi:hypothetical protein